MGYNCLFLEWLIGDSVTGYMPPRHKQDYPFSPLNCNYKLEKPQNEELFLKPSSTLRFCISVVLLLV